MVAVRQNTKVPEESHGPSKHTQITPQQHRDCLRREALERLYEKIKDVTDGPTFLFSKNFKDVQKLVKEVTQPNWIEDVIRKGIGNGKLPEDCHLQYSEAPMSIYTMSSDRVTDEDLLELPEGSPSIDEDEFWNIGEMEDEDEEEKEDEDEEYVPPPEKKPSLWSSFWSTVTYPFSKAKPQD